MLSSFKNSKKQGDAGLGVAIGWFSVNGYGVSLPLTDSQDYDLIIDENSTLKKVQVKTTRYHENNIFKVQLAVKGGNKSGTGKIKKFDNSCIDYLFVLTDKNEKYLMPAKAVDAKAQLSLGKKYEKFKLA